MGDNADMTKEWTSDDRDQDLDALEAALAEADPAEAPDSADAIADRLNALLDRTGTEPLDEEAP